MLFYIAAALIAGILFFLLFSNLIGFIAGFAAGLLAAYLYKQWKKPAPASDTSEAKPDIMTRIFQNLLKLNIDLREALEEMDVVGKVEEIIDQVRALAPEVNAKIGGSQMAWVINRMDEEYLPKLLYPYMKLDAQMRQTKKATLLAALESVKKELDEVEAMLQSSDADQFDAKAAFIAHRFSDLY